MRSSDCRQQSVRAKFDCFHHCTTHFGWTSHFIRHSTFLLRKFRQRVRASKNTPTRGLSIFFLDSGGLQLTNFASVFRRTSLQHRAHRHPLIPCNVDNGWACDGRSLPGGCRSGVTGFNQTAGMPRWRCSICDYDLCAACVSAEP